MVIEFTESFLSNLYSSNQTEFYRLFNLIKNNINENIVSLNSNQNFIYLDLNTCNFLEENIPNSSEIVYYMDHWNFITSSVQNLKRIKIIENGIEPCDNLSIQYSYPIVSKLISQQVKVIVENINDEHLYKLIINNFISKNILNKNLYVQGGNGSQTEEIVIEHIKNNEIMVIITDHDKKYYGQENPNSTPMKLSNQIKNYTYPSECIILEYKNIEGLIPFEIVKKNLNPRIKTSFDILYKHQKNKEWLKYFDFKKGFKYNLYEGKNIITNSQDWWNSQFNDLDVSSIYTESAPNDIVKKGICRIKKEFIKTSSLQNESSPEQKEEYKRISELVYPWIVANEYIQG